MPDAAFEQAIRWLYERINYEKTGHVPYSDTNYRLDRMRRLLAAMDNPHLAAPVIHIAGTKGKGSTAHFIARMLTASGYRTGLYTSPHLLRLEERFQIDHCQCTPAQLVELVDRTRQAAARVESESGGRCTFFELTTAIAFLHFARQRSDAVVLEVGLGGRLDSTNVCQPVLTVITTIGLDHQAQLGDTISAIASEKAGIIKPSVPLVCSARHPDAQAVISDRAARLQSPLRLIGRDFHCQWAPWLEASIAGDACRRTEAERAQAEVLFCPEYASALGRSKWQLSLLGRHHADNVSAALAAIDGLMEQGWTIPRSSLRGAVLDTVVPARLQVLGSNPWRIIDAAHNPDSIAATIDALNVHFPGTPRCVVLATSRDKDIESMLRLVLPNCQRVILTQYQNNPRAVPLADLSQMAVHMKFHTPIATAANPGAAWQLACQSSGPGELVCATGSFFLAAELMTFLDAARTAKNI